MSDNFHRNLIDALKCTWQRLLKSIFFLQCVDIVDCISLLFGLSDQMFITCASPAVPRETGFTRTRVIAIRVTTNGICIATRGSTSTLIGICNKSVLYVSNRLQQNMLNQMHKIKTTNRDLVYTELIQTLMSDAILKVIHYSFTVAIYYVSTTCSLMK